MKRFLLVAATAAVLALVAAPAVQAGTVFDRATNSIPITGTATWTNTAPYAAVEIKKVYMSYSAVAVTTVTVSRVVAGGTYTGTVATVTTSGGYGEAVPSNYMGLRYGDKVVLTALPTTNGLYGIEYEVQQH